jgi:hypothetical protein
MRASTLAENQAVSPLIDARRDCQTTEKVEGRANIPTERFPSASGPMPPHQPSSRSDSASAGGQTRLSRRHGRAVGKVPESGPPAYFVGRSRKCRYCCKSILRAAPRNIDSQPSAAALLRFVASVTLILFLRQRCLPMRLATVSARHRHSRLRDSSARMRDFN